MRRPSFPGLDIGGVWTIPTRIEIEPYELAYVLEVPESEVRELFGAKVPVRGARDLLKKLAGQGRLKGGGEEGWLFRHLVSGSFHIDAQGNVTSAVNGRSTGRVLQRRAQHMSMHGAPPRLQSWEEIEGREHGSGMR